jgi:hypothetical protein
MNWLLAAVAGVSVLVCLTAFLVFTFGHPVTFIVVALLLWFFWIAARPAAGHAPGSRAPAGEPDRRPTEGGPQPPG